MNGQEGLLDSLTSGKPVPDPITDRYVRIGEAVLAEAGEDACRDGYGTTDPEWVGRYAVQYGDANSDGTLN